MCCCLAKSVFLVEMWDVRGESEEILHFETSEAEREQCCALLESKCQISCEIKSRAGISSCIKQILSDCERLTVT